MPVPERLWPTAKAPVVTLTAVTVVEPEVRVTGAPLEVAGLESVSEVGVVQSGEQAVIVVPSGMPVPVIDSPTLKVPLLTLKLATLGESLVRLPLPCPSRLRVAGPVASRLRSP